MKSGFEIGWMNSFGAVHTRLKNTSKKIKGATDKNGAKNVIYVNKA